MALTFRIRCARLCTVQVSLTDGASGETVNSFALSADPYDLCVSDKKDDGYSKNEVGKCGANEGKG